MISGRGNSKILDIDELVPPSDRIYGAARVVSSEGGIADELNNYFVTIGSNLARKIPDVRYSYKEYLGRRNDKSLFWKPVTEREVFDYLCALESKKSHGYDNLPVRRIKDTATFIVVPLTYIFNLSLKKGNFPECLKVAKVTPIYKRGAKSDPENYRPISVLQ